MQLTKGEIILKGLRFHAFHGVLEQERKTGNDYVVELHLGYPIGKAMTSDALEDTLNYAEVYEVVAGVMKEPCALLERVAGKIAESLFERFPRIETIDLEITKVNPPIRAVCDGAEVKVHLINDKTK